MLRNKRKYLNEGFGVGYSVSSFRGGMGGTTRSGFGGASNLGGPNQMYTYEIKPLNHDLEQKPGDEKNQFETIKLGSKISGYAVRSNATPEKKKIRGIVHQIAQTNDGAIKYYVIFDEDTQKMAKVDPLSAALITHDPVEFYRDTTNNITSRRKEKLKGNKKIVAESLVESVKNKKEA